MSSYKPLSIRFFLAFFALSAIINFQALFTWVTVWHFLWHVLRMALDGFCVKALLKPTSSGYRLVFFNLFLFFLAGFVGLFTGSIGGALVRSLLGAFFILLLVANDWYFTSPFRRPEDPTQKQRDPMPWEEEDDDEEEEAPPRPPAHVAKNQALFAAAKNGYFDLTRRVLNNGAQVNAVNDDGVTALHLATEGGHAEIVRLLLEQGADASVTDQDDRSPMTIAEAAGNEDLIDLLKNPPEVIASASADESPASTEET